MTPLMQHLRNRIELDGPISIADYMRDCLLHPEHGYYTTRNAIGADGDFTTAPEINQMFGELLGLCLAQAWMDQGQPHPFTLAELGPGRGTLMADLLRATRAVPGFHDALQIHLVEASGKMRELQAKALAGFAPIWHDHITDLPNQPLFLVANEFFDALPIRQFVRQETGWSEKRIGLTDGALAFGLGPEAPQPLLAHRLEDTKPGDLVEICETAEPVAHHIAGLIARHGGAAVIVDYGDWRSQGDTLQALHKHAPCPVLDHAGAADLTAHVDFEALCTAIAGQNGVRHSRVTPQGVFLERLGITDRARTLAAPLTGEALENLIAAHRRLTHPEEMGNLFKVLGLFPTDLTPPPGLLP